MRAILFCLLFFWQAHASAASLADTVEEIKPSVVAIGTYQQDRAPPLKFLGTGFAVSDGNHVITNFHVVSGILDAEQQEKLVVFTGNGEKARVYGAEKVRVDRMHDLALLKFEGPAMPVLHFGDSGALREGDSLAFTGFPIGVVLGYYPVTHKATLSSITPIVIPAQNSNQLTARAISQLRTPFRVFQLDGTAYPGNSGSPLYLPETGKVVGIVNMVFVKNVKESVLSDPSGIAYAIPGDYISSLIRDAGLTP
ncbi:MAG: trypsin-like peptidase domain-containing protein [Burkholderiales bacterium]|nr:trypsin-like peptidase domain-containing protein [Burkholderiales bacterium]